MRQYLEDFTTDEQKDLDYHRELLPLRAAAYARHTATMTVPEDLKRFVAVMTRRFGPTVAVHFQPGLPWLDALMVVRYGEDAAQWPPAFTQDDIYRALAWMKGRRHENQKGSTPRGIRYPDLADGGYLSLPGASVLLVLALAKVAWMLSTVGMVGTASALTNYWENKFIDNYFRNRQTSAPAAMYAALYTAAPGETGGGTEVSGGSYARVSVGVGATTWQGTGGETTAVDSAGTGGATQNINAITFPSPTGNWGTVTDMAMLDASSSGNFLFYCTLTAAKNVNNGDPAPAFAAGAVTFTIA